MEKYRLFLPHIRAASEKIENSERFLSNVYTKKERVSWSDLERMCIYSFIAITNKFAFYIHYIHFV
jgi:hypothetical protein